VLLEPPTHIENAPALTRPEIPHDLADLALRARRDPGARRELADVLLVRSWTPDLIATALGMTTASVDALSRVRRPGTAAAHVAASLVPLPRPA
jgi:hypothetical protein